jgi:hypothetical protein
MEYKEWSKLYAYGLVLGGIIATLIVLPIFLLGYDDILPMYGWVLVWGVIVVLCVILAWLCFRKK